MRFIFVLVGALAFASCSQDAEPRPTPTTSTAATAPEAGPRAPSDIAKSDTDSARNDVGNDAGPAAEAAQHPASLQKSIPVRFHGTFAEDLRACAQPSHGLFTVNAGLIEFFESTGEVRNVRVDGNYAAATVFEQYGDSPGTTYAFYMRLMPNGALRYSYDGYERRTWIRCP